MPGITSNRSQDEKARKGNLGPLADKRMDPREAQMEGQLGTSVAAQVARDGILEEVADGEASAAEVADGMAARLARDRRNPSYEWATEPRGNEIERRDGWTQAQVEESRGREHELDRQRQKAHLAVDHDVDRAAKCREEVGQTWTEIASQTDEQDLRWTEADPREELDQETLGAVNRQAQRLADYFDHETAIGRPGFAELFARRVVDGASPTSAMFDIKENIEHMPTVRQDLADIDPYGQWQTTVEVEVTTLWTPNHGSQRQVGLVTDGTRSPIKVVVWKNSGDKPVLREGDHVRLTKAKVNAYQGDPTLAVTGDTEVVFLEETPSLGERGPGPRLKRQKDDPTPPSWSADAREHSWINGVDMERAISVTKRRMTEQRGQIQGDDE